MPESNFKVSKIRRLRTPPSANSKVWSSIVVNPTLNGIRTFAKKVAEKYGFSESDFGYVSANRLYYLYIKKNLLYVKAKAMRNLKSHY